MRVRTLLTLFFLCALTYLLTVAIWASVVVDTLTRPYVDSLRPSVLTPNQRAILLTVEDPTFFHHSGVDISNGQGLTTITSVLARDIFLLGEDLDGMAGTFQNIYRAFFRCCKKIDLGRDIMSIVLNKHLTKDQQLSLYIATVYMGHADGKAIHGFYSAAEYYYQKPLTQLTHKEYLGLVSIPLAPTRYHPHKAPKAHTIRRLLIESLITGDCEPDGWLDLTYEHCQVAALHAPRTEIQ